ncbi:MAG: glutaredoxin family protein [Acidovorax sp.]
MRAALLSIVALAACAAQAQPIYRIVGPDGKVTFSDRPPTEAQAQQAAPARASGGGSANDALPYELRQVAARFPVTLYTGNDCAPCASARNLLTQRGIPFTERTVTSNEDIAALQRIAGVASLPFATIGGQQLQGFSDAEWTQYLDMAGYPKQSQLPPGYRRPPATPLVAVVEKAPATEAPAAPAAPRHAPAPAPAAPGNPAGITF